MITETSIAGFIVIISIAVACTTEGIKKILKERDIKYYSNSLSAIVSIVLSLIAGCLYVIYNDIEFNSKIIIQIIIIVFLSWLSAMGEYDKFKQLLQQYKSNKEESL